MSTSFSGQPLAQPFVAAVFLVAVFVLGNAAIRRTPTTLSRWKALRWMHFITYSHLLSSFGCVWAFALVLFGVGLDGQDSAFRCNSSFFVAVFLFYSTKVWLHTFLCERVHLVYFSDVPRLHSWAYRALAIILLVASAVGAMVLVRRRTHIDAEGRCYVGDDLLASVSIIVVHVATEGVAAVLFLLPIFRSKFPEAKRLAKRSAISTVVSLVTSAINYAYLPLSGGSVRGWIYFSVAGLDIFINGVLMDYMTTTSSSSTPSHTFADTTCSAVLPVSTSLPFMDRRPSTTPRSPRVPGSEARSFEEFERRQSQAGAGPFSPFVVDLSGSLTGIPEK